MQTVIFVVAIGCTIAWSVVFAVLTLKVMPAARQRAEETAQRLTESHTKLKNATAQQLTDILKATASLTDSMVKTAPAFWAAVGALASLLIAVYAAIPATAPAANSTSTSETESNSVPPSENAASNTANVAQNAAAQ